MVYPPAIDQLEIDSIIKILAHNIKSTQFRIILLKYRRVGSQQGVRSFRAKYIDTSPIREFTGRISPPLYRT